MWRICGWKRNNCPLVQTHGTVETSRVRLGQRTPERSRCVTPCWLQDLLVWARQPRCMPALRSLASRLESNWTNIFESLLPKAGHLQLYNIFTRVHVRNVCTHHVHQTLIFFAGEFAVFAQHLQLYWEKQECMCLILMCLRLIQIMPPKIPQKNIKHLRKGREIPRYITSLLLFLQTTSLSF